MTEIFPDKFYEQLSNKEKDYILEYTAKSLTIRATNFVATLRVSKPVSKSFKKDILNAPDAEVALKWLYVIAEKDKKSSIAIEQRPSWCKSLYQSEEEYRNVYEKETFQIVNQKITEVKSTEPNTRKFICSPYNKTTFVNNKYPHQTHRFKHFLTWEEWIGAKGVAVEFYTRSNIAKDTPPIKEKKSSYTKPLPEIRTIESLLGDLFGGK